MNTDGFSGKMNLMAEKIHIIKMKRPRYHRN